ncbi:MAG: ribbon-helix-helix domain-containing protein [Bacillota bacterium]|nr:ribbon-helix-helix domain-containing protein [Bacillota bacterium]
MKELRRRIEAGEVEPEGEASEVRVALRAERVTIRLSEEEMRAVDREARALGVGRSTLIRMLVRQGLGLRGREESAAGQADGPTTPSTSRGTG